MKLLRLLLRLPELLAEAEEIALGLRVHQELQLYSPDLSFNSFLNGSFGLACAPE